MNYLLRTIERDRWLFILDSKNKIPAKTISDLKTDKNGGISVFEIIEDESNLEEVILSFLIQRKGIAVFDYVKLDEAELKELKFDVKTTPGGTKFKEVNKKHRDIIVETLEDLIILTEYVYSKIEDGVTVEEEDVVNIIQRAIDNAKVDYNKLHKDIQKKCKPKSTSQSDPVELVIKASPKNKTKDK